MRGTLSDLIIKSKSANRDVNHIITDSTIFDTVVFKDSNINNNAVIVSIYFTDEIMPKLLRYRAQKEKSYIKFFEFFGFDTEFKYLFSNIKNGTTLSKSKISKIVRRIDILGYPEDCHIDLYLLYDNIK